MGARTDMAAITRRSMIINRPHLCTNLVIFEPRYHDRVARPLKRKVDFASGTIIFTFPKSNAYRNGRYAMKKSCAQSYPTEKQGNHDVYLIPMDDFEPWESAQEVNNIITELGW